jgi:hypothetical protein
MLGDELEEDFEDEAVADSTPSYLMPAIPNVVPGGKDPANRVDEYGLPSAPIGNP